MTDNEFIEAVLRCDPITTEAPELAEKRRAALDWMGEQWLLHPANSPKNAVNRSETTMEVNP